MSLWLFPLLPGQKRASCLCVIAHLWGRLRLSSIRCCPVDSGDLWLCTQGHSTCHTSDFGGFSQVSRARRLPTFFRGSRFVRTECREESLPGGSIPPWRADRVWIRPESTCLWALRRLLATENLPSLPKLFHELSIPAVGPRVVGERKLDAIRHGRVVVKQEHIHGVGLGIAEVHVTVKAK